VLKFEPMLVNLYSRKATEINKYIYIREIMYNIAKLVVSMLLASETARKIYTVLSF
jgi:hypothetical protein